ncbi:MAG: phenylacetic acid degradation bifunctional protein PaaZ [Chitinophagaceae bacterium]|nr:phenylacetic acid degradation bifunctional protein PaaZ [Chitinophagaceae bacterium]
MQKLSNYITGQWVYGEGEGQWLFNAVTGEPIATASTKGIDFQEVLDYARNVGNPALRKMTFHERGRMLKTLALHLQKQLPHFYSVSAQTGATRNDSWVDLEGGLGNLFTNSSLRRKFPDETFCVDGESHPFGKMNTFMGTHILVPKEGVAVHINAYNFPVWGMLEKCAVNWLAGMPAIVKPATVTSYLAEAVVKEIIASGLLPEGALQLLCGSAGDILDRVQSQDVVTFTGSASTGLMLKKTPAILENNVPFNMEADSLNCIVLGADVEPGMPEWEAFVKEVRREMTLKAGQRCTGVRRIFVPENKLEDVATALIGALSKTTIGNPAHEKVRMGSLAGQSQREELGFQVQKLLSETRMIYGSLDTVELIDADAEKGAFVSPMLLLNESPMDTSVVHEVEAFGPVSTLMPYKTTEEAIALSKLGRGSLVTTIVTNDEKIARDYVVGAASHHGRILVLNGDCAQENTGHGSPLPLLVHGGPGRAGGGEEMGGIRGVKHYMQRTALQGSPAMITAITNVYQTNAPGKDPGKHPFKKYYEELQIGDQILTEKILITSEDIDRFADLSGDHFYAHIDTTDFEGTMFEKQVAHGYLLMSRAAGLFVDSYEKNPVLLNYGIDELRFTKPVYPGAEMQVRFTCKEKVPVDKRVVNNPEDARRGDDIEKGIVKWLVEMLDGEGEVTGVGTILTMVARKDGNPNTEV